MNAVKFLKRILAVIALLALVTAAYMLWARPYQLHWGATQAEISRAMPGDEMNTAPTFLATRAITIKGTPEQIWPWLVQMGFERAGFYGYDILEGMGSSEGMQSAMTILPELQNFQVGDPVPLSVVSVLTFSAIEPNQYLIWAGQESENLGGFVWALYPIDTENTRLVSRVLWRHHAVTQPDLLALDLFTDLADHIAVRKILMGVKGRVEGYAEPAWVTNLEFFYYVATFLIFLAAVLVNLLRPLTGRRWLLGLAAGLGWLVSWYAPLPVAVTVVIELLVLAGLLGGIPRAKPRARQTMEMASGSI